MVLVPKQQVCPALRRRHGQPLLATCAALTVSDVTAAVTALHLGNEPEQAAMMVLALGQLGGVDQYLQDRVFGALATKSEAAGDWGAAAAAIRLQSKDDQHQLQLLVVRHERSSSKAAAKAASDGSNTVEPAEQEPGLGSNLRQQLGLKAASYYAAVADSAADSLESVRYDGLQAYYHRSVTDAAGLQHLSMDVNCWQRTPCSC